MIIRAGCSAPFAGVVSCSFAEERLFFGVCGPFSPFAGDVFFSFDGDSLVIGAVWSLTCLGDPCCVLPFWELLFLGGLILVLFLASLRVIALSPPVSKILTTALGKYFLNHFLCFQTKENS